MQAAVGDQEDLAARNLAVDDAADVDARFADQIAAELDRRAAPAAARARALRDELPRGCAPIGARSSGCSPGKVRDAETAADVEHPHRRGRVAATVAARARRSCAALRRSPRRCRFCEPAEDVKAFERRARRADLRAAASGTRSASMPNCFGPPPIFMPEDLSSKSGLTRTATRAGATRRSRQSREHAHLARRFDVDAGRRPRPPARARRRVLPGPAKLISRGSTPASSATRSSPPEATSRPSTSARHDARRAPASDWPSSRSAA